MADPKCTTIKSSICGSEIIVKSVTFPNATLFDSTILKIINGSDSQKLLSNYSGCTKVNARYSKSFWCGFIAANQAKICSSENKFQICSSTCYAMIKSSMSFFKDEKICVNSTRYVQRRLDIIHKMDKYCKTHTKLPENNCIMAVPEESNNCGFSSQKEAVDFCKSSNAKCCVDASVKEEIESEGSKGLETCQFFDILCWSGLQIGLTVALSLFVLVCVGAIVAKLSKRHSKKDELTISNPDKSDDHDYSTFVKDLPDPPTTHTWYDSESASDPTLSTDSSI